MLKVVYRPPNKKGNSLLKFNSEFNDLRKILKNYCLQSRTKLLIPGDFDINLIALSSNQKIADFINNAYSAGLFPTTFFTYPYYK